MSNDRLHTGYMVGGALIALGLLVLVKGGFYQLGYYVDFHGYHMPFGIALCIIGVFFILTALRRKPKDKKKEGHP
ncbi:MAG: hypothetical protein RDU59_04745 [Thermodesulfobacteriota bacterium]|nr:hypothetical protein [Thermodesulfobacteriota bacterium]